MPTMILKYWPYLLAAGGALVLFLYWNGRNNELDDLRTQVANQAAEIVIKDATYKENKRKLTDQIDRQNIAINKANDDYTELERRTSIAVAASNAENAVRVTKLKKQLDLLGSISTPQTCESAINLLVDIGVANKWSTQRN